MVGRLDARVTAPPHPPTSAPGASLLFASRRARSAGLGRALPWRLPHRPARSAARRGRPVLARRPSPLPAQRQAGGVAPSRRPPRASCLATGAPEDVCAGQRASLEACCGRAACRACWSLRRHSLRRACRRHQPRYMDMVVMDTCGAAASHTACCWVDVHTPRPSPTTRHASRQPRRCRRAHDAKARRQARLARACGGASLMPCSGRPPTRYH